MYVVIKIVEDSRKEKEEMSRRVKNKRKRGRKIKRRDYFITWVYSAHASVS